MNKIIVIPFDGFYNSIISNFIEREVESEQEVFLENEKELPSNFYDYSVDFKKISKRYVKIYKDWLLSEHGLNLPSLSFDSLKSPREYNFTTDKIYCSISELHLEKLFNWAEDNLNLQFEITEKFSSRDGFTSFYDDFVEDWCKKDILEWDHNELSVLLPEPESYFDLWEGDACNGFFNQCIEFGNEIGTKPTKTLESLL